jgi:hypothetical protein
MRNYNDRGAYIGWWKGAPETTGVTHKSGSGVESVLISPREKILARSKRLIGKLFRLIIIFCNKVSTWFDWNTIAIHPAFQSYTPLEPLRSNLRSREVEITKMSWRSAK